MNSILIMDCINGTDKKVLPEIIRGNQQVFEVLFHNMFPRLHKYATLLINDSDVAKDIVQEAFINLWSQCRQLSNDQSVEAVVYRYVRNRCMNYLRDDKIHRQHLKLVQYEELEHVVQYDFLGYEERTVHELMISEMEKAITLLPEKCKQAFILNKIEGKKQAEIAQQMNISVKMVEKHIATAKVKLTKHLTYKFPMYINLACYILDAYLFSK